MNKNLGLKRVSEDAIKEVFKYDVVLPALYRDIFYQKSKELGVEFKDDIETSLQYATKKIKDYEDKVASNASKLEEGMQKAAIAINNKNIDEIEKIKEEIKNLQKELSEIKIELFKDVLTGVHNRKWLREVYSKNGAFKTTGILAFLDLNHFKEINDTHGHLAGDKILQYFAQNLCDICNDDIFVLRYAGDEFMVIFENMELYKAQEIIEKIKNKIDKKLFKVKDINFKITFSVGYAVFKKDDGMPEIIEIADKNMYTNKKKGK